MSKWQMKPLGDLCVIERGGSPRPIDEYITDDPNGVNWIKIGDTTESMYITATKEKIIPEGIKKSRYVKKGDFILSNSMSFGRPYILDIDGCIHDGWLVIRDNDELFDKRFLYYFLGSPVIYEKFKSMAVGGVVNNLNIDMVKKVSVPILSLSEQRKIADELDKVTKIIDYRKQQLSKLDELVKARFVEMFGDIKTGTYKFQICKLGDVAKVGSSHRVFTTDFVEDGVPFYRGTEIGELANGIIPENPYRITKEHYDRLACDETKPKVGDLLMPSICNKGQIWMVDTEEPFYYKDGRVLCISPDRKLFNCKYLEQFMREKTLVEYPKLGSGSTFAEFKIFLLKDIDVLIPPIELQNEFADFVKQTEKSKLSIQQSLEKLETLKKSLMQQYFG
ncbi:restriction endonuclease subunit S [bacterium]|nr:restriction endonuclease subunit S [bacterium]